MRVLYLHVDAHNEAAIRLYLRAGFQRVEETMETFNFASALGLLSGKRVVTHGNVLRAVEASLSTRATSNENNKLPFAHFVRVVRERGPPFTGKEGRQHPRFARAIRSRE